MVEVYWVMTRIVIPAVLFFLIVSFFQFFVSIHPFRLYDRDKPENHGLKYENVTFTTTDGIRIHAWLIGSAKAKGTVIIGHGYPFNKGNILHLAKFLHPDYRLLFYDHRYFGESGGSITTIGIKEVEDVKAAVKFVKDRSGNKEKIALYGFSLSASTMLMAQPEVDAIIGDSPYSDLESMIKAVYKIFGPLKYPFVKMTNVLSMMFFGTHPKDASPAMAVKDSKIPTLLIHGERDSQIPADNSRRIKESNPDIELWIVEGADHGQAHTVAGDEYEVKVKEFLKKHM